MRTLIKLLERRKEENKRRQKECCSCCAGNLINVLQPYIARAKSIEANEYNKLVAKISLRKQTNLCYCYNLWYYIGRHITEEDTVVEHCEQSDAN